MINIGSEMEIWESDPKVPMLSVTIGRAVNSVFALRPRKLHEVISRLLSNNFQSSPSSFGSEESPDYSLWFIINYVEDAQKRNSKLDELLVPIVQHWLKNRGMKSGDHSYLLIDCLFQKEELFQYVATKYTDIIMNNNDRYLALAWCSFTHRLVEFETYVKHFQLNGLKEHYISFIKLLSACVPKLLQIVLDGSLLQDGNELPTRLALSAANCILTITIVLATKTDDSSGNPKSFNSEVIQDTLIDSTSILWNQVDALISLLQKLHLWSKKSRSLHSFGVEKVLNWMRVLNVKADYDRDEQETRIVKRQGKLMLLSCWKHYSILLHLEDRKVSKLYQELIDQYLGGMQHYTNACDGDRNVSFDDAIDTRKFFLNCICLLMGRLDVKKLELVMSENKERFSQLLLQQKMHSEDDDLVATAVMVFKSVVLKPESFQNSQIHNELDGVLSLLFDLLDERLSFSKPVVFLIAEYCSMNLENYLDNVLDHINAKDTHQRKNALLVLSELFSICQNSSVPLENHLWKKMVNKVVSCLSDEDKDIRDKVSVLLTNIDPALVLSPIFRLMYSSNNKVQVVAIRTLKGMLANFKHNFDAIRLFIDCMSDIVSKANDKTGSKNDADPAHQVLLHWSESVSEWNLLIPQLVEMMFSNPENAAIVRFMSLISDHLAKAPDIIMYHVLSKMEVNKSNMKSSNQKQSLLELLSPLLIIRLLPVKIFDNFNSSIMYGKVSKDMKLEDPQDSIVGNLIKISYDTSQFEEVRKLSAELCGRIHPQVLIPFVSSSLEDASTSFNIINIKTSLFSLCTSLAVRNKETLSFCSPSHIIPPLENILSKSCLDNDEEYKAQHGCIDCLAMLICAEMLPIPQSSFTDYVLNGLLSSANEIAFRICLANSLKSACGKISSAGRKSFVERIIPRIVISISDIGSSEVTKACYEVLFSTVYHLKSAVAAHSRRLFQCSLYGLSREAPEVRLAGAKLIAAILAADEPVLEGISDEIVDAKSALLNALSCDSSMEIQRLCRQLLSCLSCS